MRSIKSTSNYAGGSMTAPLLDALRALQSIIERRRRFEYLAPFETHEVLEALRTCYVSTSQRRLKRLAVSLAHKLNQNFEHKPDWHRLAMGLVSRVVRSCFFRPKTIPGSRRRRLGGSSFFSARLNLRNAP